MSEKRRLQDQRLRPQERLRRPSAYKQVFQCGTKLVAPLFILYLLPTSTPYSRLGLAVSKRVGSAVTRNRVKRRLREIFRHHKTFLKSPHDIVVVARREAAQAPFSAYTQQYLSLLRRYQAVRKITPDSPAGEAPSHPKWVAGMDDVEERQRL